MAVGEAGAREGGGAHGILPPPLDRAIGRGVRQHGRHHAGRPRVEAGPRPRPVGVRHAYAPQRARRAGVVPREEIWRAAINHRQRGTIPNGLCVGN